MKKRWDYYANYSYAAAHHIAYQLHVDEMTATLAQLTGPDFDIAALQVTGLQSMGKSRLEALGAVIRLYRSTRERAYARPDHDEELTRR